MFHLRPKLLIALLGVLAAAIVASTSLHSRTASANPLGGFAKINGGIFHSCGLMTDSSVKCWGADFGGPPNGGGGSDWGLVPGMIPGLSGGVTSITSGLYHNCAVVASGEVQCFGGGYGHTPVTVSAFGSNNVSVSAGWDYTCALQTTGGIACYFVDGTPIASTGLTSGITQVAASIGFHTCVLTTVGTVKCWGFNDYGQVGDGTTIPRPTAVTVAGLSNVVQIGLGTFYSCALTSAGGVKCWGDGFGTSPVDVPGLTSGITQISVNVQHFCALTMAGGVQCRGANQFGQLGDGQACGNFCTTMVNVEGLSSGVSSIGTGVDHSCAVMTTGQAKCWGLNVYGGLGDGAHYRQRPVPGDVAATFVKPTPTPTPCPATCPTPTPTPYVPRTGLDFSIAIDTNGDNVNDCKTTGNGPTTCNVQIGSPFNVKFYLNSLPTDLADYGGFAATIGFTGGLTWKNSYFMTWPDCLISASSPPPVANFACITVGGSVYTGLMARTVFTCGGSGDLSLVHGPADTSLVDQNLQAHFESGGPADTLTVNCVSLPPTATFTAGPPATPTALSVGGIALDTSGGGGGRGSSGYIALSVLLSCGLLVVVGWRLARRGTGSA